MKHLGLGVDIVKPAKLALLVEDPDGDFLDRCFTPLERESALMSCDNMVHLATCFAVKEAVAKALGIGFGSGVAPLDIEVQLLNRGEVIALLHGAPRQVSERLGVSRWRIDVDATPSMVLAVALATGLQ
jgi:holo-[acyl-carrier protein] synthase